MPLTHKHNKKMSHKKLEKELPADRLSKRLCYILRYGAVKEGLTVHEGGKVISVVVLHSKINKTLSFDTCTCNLSSAINMPQIHVSIFI